MDAIQQEIERYENELVRKQNEKILLNQKIAINENEQFQLVGFIATLKELKTEKK